MYKFIITIDCVPGGREKILARAPVAQAATRAEAGCLQYDFFACTDKPERLVFVETWQDRAAHDFHMEQAHTKDFIAFHEQFHDRLVFETVQPATDQ
ncbi:putative quinol monooxygenase [Maritimibacter alexandrii]|uniref:putative quinol monooxygenase n=1 Tax=Maritimibacter alexandrii TaxID=2570355 RepID=UPI0011096929|nr:putative quinol monooxygenase [Maritimibacter alexandrii]